MYGDIEPEILTESSEESFHEIPDVKVSHTTSSIARYWLSRAKGTENFPRRLLVLFIA